MRVLMRPVASVADKVEVNIMSVSDLLKDEEGRCKPSIQKFSYKEKQRKPKHKGHQTRASRFVGGKREQR